MKFKKFIILLPILFLGVSCNKPQLKVTDQPSPQQQTYITSKTDIEEAYFNSRFRVIYLMRFIGIKSDLIVATQRPITSEYVADDSCGAFGESDCYFFIEPLNVASPPQRHFLTMYGDDGRFANNQNPWGDLDLNSIKKVAENAIEFVASEGGGGGRWQLDLTTGKFSPVGKIKPVPDSEGGY